MFTAMLLVRNIIVVKVLVGATLFDIGGRSKDFSQIAGVKDSYVFADDWDMPDVAKLPLWMLGVLVLERTAIGTSLR